MNVQLSNYSVSVGATLTVKIGDHEGLVGVSALGLHICEIGEADFTSMTATSAAVVSREWEIEATLTLSDFFKPGSVYEIRRLELGNEDNFSMTLVGGRDFPRCCSG